MTLSLARVLYRSLLRTSRKLDAQIQRHASVDVFTEVRGSLYSPVPHPARLPSPRVADVSRRTPRPLPSRALTRRPPSLGFPPAPRLRFAPRRQTESAQLRELLPHYKTSLALGARAAVDRLIGNEFRAGAVFDARRDAEEVGRRLDDAVVANALLRRRVELLESMAAVPTSDTVTDGVRVVVHSALVPEMSSPRDGTFVYSYKVAITNESAEEPVQVVSRHWEITDEDGHVEEVRGTGLVGFQPVLETGKAFEYTSQAPLRRLRGTMRGVLTAVGQRSKKLVELRVGAFALTPPKAAANNAAGEKEKPARTKGRRVDRTPRTAKEAAATAGGGGTDA